MWPANLGGRAIVIKVGFERFGWISTRKEDSDLDIGVLKLS